MRSFDLREAVARLDALEKKVGEAPAQSDETNAQSQQPTKSPRVALETPVAGDTPVAVQAPAEPVAAIRRKEKPNPVESAKVEPDQKVEPLQVVPRKKTPAGPAPESPTPEPAIGTPRPTGPGLFSPPALQKKTNPENLSTKSTAVEGSLAISANPKSRVPDSIEALWLKYVSTVKSLRIHVGSLLQHAAPIDVVGQAVLVAIPDDFHRRLLDNQHDFLLKHLNAASEKAYKKIEFVVRDLGGDESTISKKEEFDPYEYMKRKRQESPIVKAIFEDFGGELVW